jgi:hypothetical protein
MFVRVDGVRVSFSVDHYLIWSANNNCLQYCSRYTFRFANCKWSGQVRVTLLCPLFSRRKRSMHFSILHFWVDGSLMPSKMWLDICYCYHGLESMTRFLYFLVILNEESKSRIWISFFSEPPFIIRQAEVQSYQFPLAELRARLAYQLQNKLNFWLNYVHRDSKTLAWSLISLTICGPQPSPHMLVTTWSINNLFLHGLGLTNCWLQVP